MSGKKKQKYNRGLMRKKIAGFLTSQGFKDVYWNMKSKSFADIIATYNPHYINKPPKRTIEYFFNELFTNGKIDLTAVIPKPKKQTKRHKSLEFVQTKDFLWSPEWRRLRYDVLKDNAGKCQLCGRSAKDGIVLNIDHIKPRMKYPELALVKSNLQVLCGECNHGKGNRDDTDWR